MTHMPPYMNLSPSVLFSLDEEYAKFLAVKVLSGDELTWFENAICEGEEAAEYDYLGEQSERLQEKWDREQEEGANGEEPENYHYLVVDAIADGALESSHDYFYAEDDYGADEYENNAERYLDI